MTDSTPAPVKGLLKSFARGITLTQRICKNARNGSASHMLDVVEPAQVLEKSLGASELRIKDAYAESSRAFGKRFGEAVINNAAITNRIQALTINIQDQVLSLDDYMDDPEAFDLGSFRYIQREAERCCEQAIHTLGLLHADMLQSGMQNFSMDGSDARASLPSAPKPVPGTLSPRDLASSGGDLSTSPGSRLSASPPKSTSRGHTSLANINTHMSSPASHYDTDLPTPSSYGTYKASYPAPPAVNMPPPPPPIAWQTASMILDDKVKRSATVERKRVGSGDSKLNMSNGGSSRNRSESAGALSVRSLSGLPENAHESIPEADEAGAQTTIKSEEIDRQAGINEAFLERRKRNRISFQQEMQHIRSSSRQSTVVISSGPDQLGGSHSVLSPSDMVASPIQQSRMGSDLLMTRSYSRESDQLYTPGHGNRFSTATTDSRPSIASESPSFGHLRMERQDSGEQMMFGPPESPPHSDRGSNTNNIDWGILARTLKTPDFGRGVEDGIQVVGPGLVSDPGLILAAEVGKGEAPPVTPAISIQATDFPITQDSSFYKYGGFCEGAKTLLNGDDALRVQKKPGGMGFTALVSMKCIKCAYEIGFETYENDKVLDRSGIYNIVGGGGTRFRQRFLSKSHLNTKHMHDSAYGCLFCIEEARKVDSHDATVFFSVTQLLTHIQKHARPLPVIDGVKVLYGEHPSAVDFDLNFKDEIPSPNPFADLTSKLSVRPTAVATVNHRASAKGYRDRDPSGQKTLQFAVGAKIIGVTYPPAYGGNWCCGYHDNVRAFFPSSTIQLDAPPSDMVQMAPKSTMSAVARWAHQPPEHLKDTWLSFKSKETIKNIGFPYGDYWCYSGMNSKGKYGLFPAAFIDNIHDAGGGKSSAVKEVGRTVTKVLNDGAKDRWSGSPNAGLGMWGVMTTAAVGMGSNDASNPYAANAPRPVRKSRKSTAGFSDSASMISNEGLEIVGSLTPASPSEHRKSFMGISLGRRNTNASRNSEDGAGRSPG